MMEVMVPIQQVYDHRLEQMGADPASVCGVQERPSGVDNAGKAIT